ncbi:hypothetical protein V1478_012286 [Vespula squamosa]|uniref:Uncharacterized protein n=1 Tax=Vespula squamosa TaxID=30214 RepID=A0ABD2ACZ3_VESSQ
MFPRQRDATQYEMNHIELIKEDSAVIYKLTSSYNVYKSINNTINTVEDVRSFRRERDKCNISELNVIKLEFYRKK